MKALVLAEHDGQHIKISTRQAIRAARALAAEVDVLLFGADLTAVAAAAQALEGVSRVRLAEAAHLAFVSAEDAAAVIAALAPGYTAIVAAHGSFARDILPRAAGLLDAGMLSDVLEILPGNDYVRPIYAGNLQATVHNEEPIQILTVRGSRFEPVADGGAASVERLALPAADTRVEHIALRQADSDGPDLSSARIVVSGGRSLGSQEQFAALLEPLASTLGAALGATRAAVDAGYAPNEIQVGQTGIIVAPDCYIAIGVSGAAQHTAGMKDSKVVVAINQDPDAPIFDVADYGLVADLFTAVPELTAALRPQP
ncbi:MAG: FAD-binding protein [Candidatus Dactylopiibacterium sp.]|nr:FAD-binding protein [Candidatus Dactylopiibacterium sp.]